MTSKNKSSVKLKLLNEHDIDSKAMRESVIALANSQGEFKQLGMLLMDMLATSDDWDTFRKYFDARRKKEPQKDGMQSKEFVTLLDATINNFSYEATLDALMETHSLSQNKARTFIKQFSKTAKSIATLMSK